MELCQRSLRFRLMKFCIFSFLVTVSCFARAEYYQVYSAPEFSDQCAFCTTPHARHGYHHRSAHRQVAHHRYHHRQYGLTVSYPVGQRPPCPCNEIFTSAYCECCPTSNRVRSQYGDYVVFSSRPVDSGYGKYPPIIKNTYDPDTSTSDDGRADMEIN